ncbi:hypothetical protein KY385_01670 [Candidatus Parcubacteria bacterium]|nr:hypothetical protein [Candidatus Parcubacteria bacterium]
MSTEPLTTLLDEYGLTQFVEVNDVKRIKKISPLQNIQVKRIKRILGTVDTKELNQFNEYESSIYKSCSWYAKIVSDNSEDSRQSAETTDLVTLLENMYQRAILLGSLIWVLSTDEEKVSNFDKDKEPAREVMFNYLMADNIISNISGIRHELLNNAFEKFFDNNRQKLKEYGLGFSKTAKLKNRIKLTVYYGVYISLLIETDAID